MSVALPGDTDLVKYFVSRTVIILGMVSFLNDTANEMITPLLPLFLTATLGAGPFWESSPALFTI